MKSHLRIIAGLGLALAFSLTASPSAHATLQVRITATVNGMISTYAGPLTSSPNVTPDGGNDGTEITGSIANFDGFRIQGLDILSSLTERELQFGTTKVTNNNTSGSNATLVITATEDAYQTPPGSGSYGLNLSSSATTNTITGTNSSTTFQSYAGNTAFDEATFTTGPQIAKMAQVSTLVGHPFQPAGTAFSITNASTFNLAGGGGTAQTQGDSVVSTPEPSTFAIALAGLPVVGLVVLRRRRVSARSAVV